MYAVEWCVTRCLTGLGKVHESNPEAPPGYSKTDVSSLLHLAAASRAWSILAKEARNGGAPIPGWIITMEKSSINGVELGFALV